MDEEMAVQGRNRAVGKALLLTDADAELFFDRLAASISPRCELEYTTLLDLLVAVVLSAQSTDKAVNQVTAELWQHCRTPEDYLALGTSGLESFLRRLGLFRAKSCSIIGICEQLLERHGGEVPSTREELMALPGVGRKTANVILNVGFGEPTLAVDTHVFRVANRSGLVAATTPEAVEEALLPRVPERHRRHAHHYLVLHGRYTCRARRPECATCVVADLCVTARQDLSKSTRSKSSARKKSQHGTI